MFQRNCKPEKETESLANMSCEQGLEKVGLFCLGGTERKQKKEKPNSKGKGCTWFFVMTVDERKKLYYSKEGLG